MLFGKARHVSMVAMVLFRPMIGAPIAAFILVASRCAMFSTLFTSKDLNTYLVISFIAGFAMMEFLSMLRSTSKGLFDKNGEKPKKKNAQDATDETEEDKEGM